MIKLTPESTGTFNAMIERERREFNDIFNQIDLSIIEVKNRTSKSNMLDVDFMKKLSKEKAKLIKMNLALKKALKK